MATNTADWLNLNQTQFIEMADTIWGHPEIRWEEFQSSKLQADFMEEAGFDVTWDVGGITTAFMAEWSNGPADGSAGCGGVERAGLCHRVEGAPRTDRSDPRTCRSGGRRG